MATLPRIVVTPRWLALSTTACAVLMMSAVQAAPYKPQNDQQVLVRLPAAGSTLRSQQITRLRQQLGRDPRQPGPAAELTWLHLNRLLAEGDPRDAGYAQAALAPWWTDPAPPADLRVARAVLRQFSHDFDAALADLDAVVQQDPGQTQAWAWIVSISMVQARYERARQACEQGLQTLPALQRTACRATVDAATGQARRAAADLQQALTADPEAAPELRLWALTRLAETHERLAAWPAAEQAYREALALGVEDSYLLAAMADFLLDRGRPAEVIRLLQGRERNDLHLLRLALAAKALRDPRLAAWQSGLAARFDAARLRGDTAHQKEEARFALDLLGDSARALPLASANYALQREAADARVLLEAALAARQRAAAAPVLAWLHSSHFESTVLRALAAQVEALP